MQLSNLKKIFKTASKEGTEHIVKEAIEEDAKVASKELTKIIAKKEGTEATEKVTKEALENEIKQKTEENINKRANEKIFRKNREFNKKNIEIYEDELFNKLELEQDSVEDIMGNFLNSNDFKNLEKKSNISIEDFTEEMNSKVVNVKKANEDEYAQLFNFKDNKELNKEFNRQNNLKDKTNTQYNSKKSSKKDSNKITAENSAFKNKEEFNKYSKVKEDNSAFSNKEKYEEYAKKNNIETNNEEQSFIKKHDKAIRRGVGLAAGTGILYTMMHNGGKQSNEQLYNPNPPRY